MADLLTGLRLILVAPFAWLLWRGDWPPTAAGSDSAALAWAGALVFAVAIASDLLDGPVARRRGTARDFGRLFDHGTDFLFVTVGLCAASAIGAVPWFLPLFIAVAFAQYVIDSYLLGRNRQLRMSWLGKWNGILYFFPLGGVLLVKLGLGFLAAATTWLAWVLCASTLASIVDRWLSMDDPG